MQKQRLYAPEPPFGVPLAPSVISGWVAQIRSF
jgi:hypothetical protein